MKVLLAVGAVMVALLAGTLTGGMMSATGEEPPARTGVAQVAAEMDKSSKERSQGNPAARDFVAAKKEWTACVAEAAPAHDVADGRFDPEQACGPKPHPHDIAGKHADKPGAKKHSTEHGKPAWSGGPDRRTAEPPGHAEGDRATGRG